METDVPIRVIHNFIDLRRFDVRPCPEAAALRQGNEKVLVHVSNFRPVKRVPLLVQAFADLAATMDARLLLVGDGPDLPAAQSLARCLKVADRVHFLGSQDAIEKILPCADVFVLPSQYESFGLAALEAMACGVPVVATRAGGIPEVVEEGVTGELCPVDDRAGLVAALTRVLADPGRRRELARNARERAGERFALERILPLYDGFYREVLGLR
jgi:N-acetyl-alpha-D-glucosaminyl L-malate synthase BshA